MINVTSAFTLGCSGSMTEASASKFNDFMGDMYNNFSNLTGWLGETLTTVKEAHNKFMSSRLWEFSNRINGKDGVYVGRFDIGYLSQVKYQQNATGFMRDYIMANPTLMDLYVDERISGYEGDFSKLCTGSGRGNYFFNKSTDGLLELNRDENTLNRSNYHCSKDNLSHLTFRERVDIQRTWRASNIHAVKNLFDPTSILNEKIYSLEEVIERKEKEKDKE
jgi:hypothetical protein